jgi:ubiquinone/menaquinone biosynthesis C-methylase UbiE
VTEVRLMDDLYQELWAAHEKGVYGILDDSLRPRSSSMMLDLAQEAGLKEEQLVLDIGCGQGNRAYDLRERFSCRVYGLDPALVNLKFTRKEAHLWEGSDQVAFQQGLIGRLPYADGCADLVWCRDMLVHVRDLEGAMFELARVMKPDGVMVLMVTLGTDLLHEEEARRLFEGIRIKPRNLSAELFEATLEQTGLRVEKKEDTKSERVEYLEEREGQLSREILRLSRMLREGERLAKVLGRDRFRVAKALYYWGIYLMIGKLSDVYYILRK